MVNYVGVLAFKIREEDLVFQEGVQEPSSKSPYFPFHILLSHLLSIKPSVSITSMMLPHIIIQRVWRVGSNRGQGELSQGVQHLDFAEDKPPLSPKSPCSETSG